jgi:glycyl-tRNA synthetase
MFRSMGFAADRIRLRQHLPSERAHYAADAWDVEVLTRSFGWVECCGVHDRGSYDLDRHQEFSKTRMSVKADGVESVPNVLEIAFGVERPLFSLIDNAYDEDSERTWLRFPPQISPMQVAVFPLMAKDELMPVAADIYYQVMDAGLAGYFDKSGSIGRRYRRQDEVGTPFCVTVDYQTLQDRTVTIRERDSMKQVRVKIEELTSLLKKLVSGRVTFDSLF